MLDFSSALYLGLRHPSASLPGWDALTLGRPAALQELPGAGGLAMAVAQLQGCKAGVLAPSTLHLFWDLFDILGQQDIMILQDAASYPIVHWGVERAAAAGIAVATFAGHSVPQATKLARQAAAAGLRPVIVTDGYSPSLGRPAPLAAYAAIAANADGYLVLDDTQALGVFGAGSCKLTSWGCGGGGSLQRQQVFGDHVIVGVSLAKAFGAPLAVLSGSLALVRRFEDGSRTRTHSSPPSMAVMQAAEQALRINRQSGDRLRRHLMRLVRQLRCALDQLGLHVGGGDFPVQTIASTPTCNCLRLHQYLARHEVLTVLQRSRRGGALLSLIVNADHTATQLLQATALLADGLIEQGRQGRHRQSHMACQANGRLTPHFYDDFVEAR